MQSLANEGGGDAQPHSCSAISVALEQSATALHKVSSTAASSLFEVASNARRWSWPVHAMLHSPRAGSSVVRDRGRKTKISRSSTFGNDVLNRFSHVSALRERLLLYQAEYRHAYRTLMHHSQAVTDLQHILMNTVDENRQDTHANDRLAHLLMELKSGTEKFRSQLQQVQSLDSDRTRMEYELSMHESALFLCLQGLLGMKSKTTADAGSTSNLLSPQADSYHSEELPSTLREYYEAAGWVGVLRERLDDLRFTYYDSLEKRRLDPTSATSSAWFRTPSDQHFQQEEAEMITELQNAWLRAQELEQACKDRGIQIDYPLQSSLAPSNASAILSDDYGPASVLPEIHLPLLRGETNFSGQSRTLVATQLSDVPRQKTKHKQTLLNFKAGSFVNKWALDTWNHIKNGFAQQLGHEESPSDIFTSSATSLPDYVMVDKHPLEGQEQSRDEVQTQNSLGILNRRKFGSRRMWHSDSSMLAESAESPRSALPLVTDRAIGDNRGK